MPWWLDLTSYLVTFCGGVAVGRYAVTRTLTVTEHDGHPVIELRHDHERD